MISLGVDLSLTHTGVVLLEDGKIKDKKSILTKPEGKRPVDEIVRINFIVNEVLSLAEEADVVVIEGIAFGVSKTTAVMQLAGLNYLLRTRLKELGKNFLIIAPTSLKKFVTGNGRAPKDEMIITVFKKWNVTLLDNNICDAYALAQVGLSYLDKERKINKVQRSVISLLNSQI